MRFSWHVLNANDAKEKLVLLKKIVNKDITISYIKDIDFRDNQEICNYQYYVVDKVNDENTDYHVNIFMEMLVFI